MIRMKDVLRGARGLLLVVFLGTIAADLSALAPSSGAGVSVHYIVYHAPPSGSAGQSLLLTQGWHGAYTLALDWDNTQTTSDVFFRGWGYRGGSPLEDNRLRGRPYTLSSGEYVCDVVDVQVRENPDGQYLRYDMLYTHTAIYSPNDFPILTSDSKAWNDYRLAYMVTYDHGCDFRGSHVHESHVPPGAPVVASTNGGLYPAGSCPNDNCGTFQNNIIANSTRAFDWWSN